MKRQILYDFSNKRYLVWPCSQGQGIEHCQGPGRKAHEKLQFDRPTVTVLRTGNFWKCVVQCEWG